MNEQASGPGERPGTLGTTSVEVNPALPLQRGVAPEAPAGPRGRWASTRPAYRYLHIAAAGLCAAVAGVALATALGGGSATETLTGTLALWQDGSAPTAGTPCEGSGAYADLRAGAPVRIVGDGETLATSTLQPGRSDGNACGFGFLVPRVGKAGAYQIVVGSDRVAGALSYADLREQSWNARVTIGA